MGSLIYSMITSLDGYAIGPDGSSEFLDVDQEAHDFFAQQMTSFGTFLYGRRMYETMLFWETAHLDPDYPPFIADFARAWQAIDKVVYSRTLEDVASERTRIERSFEPEEVRAFVTASDLDVTIDGPELAAQAIRAGIVDEFQPIVGPVVAGGGTPFFPAGTTLALELLNEYRFASGGVWLRYRPTRT
ncbi:dihydrofolate reductase family protein [Agromyces atrinae]|uniref:Deaminase n=1 Tax=Agromyces atrinae TaxID=592376 RepID=A0A4Q2M8N4_9MICO|nr:dihydrofolate reductase family protein [Agromyces atrinae]NYD68117.1 dihydrofolate reductase [Agromyces atrinae]RXZ87737.1 deaminase [Agromyces atrinae]